MNDPHDLNRFLLAQQDDYERALAEVKNGRTDPNGAPLANAPNQMAGGVFAGNLTSRMPTQVLSGGLNRGAVGTAFLGRSPDGSAKAVFSVVIADGSIVQANTLKAVDGLAPVGTVSPLFGRRWDEDGENGNGVSPRLGVILNYAPQGSYM